ncbi:MAG TPA: glucose-6-phosphate dehydrogenase [Longimicrobiales bacterium]|nr:glucose-6-phosphate dehydrogenase [Longimicrobiales bacterium]
MKGGVASGYETTLGAAAEGIRRGPPADPCVMVLFGASGDLARRSLIPSLYELHCKGLLPERFALVGSARSQWDDERFRDVARLAVEEGCEGPWNEAKWQAFEERLSYVRADTGAPVDEEWVRLASSVQTAREHFDIPDNVFFHLAVPPDLFGPIAERLGACGLARSESGWRRVVVEKPFGQDLESARALDASVRSIFDEGQVYRIDHFLGKETVQNMLVFRFANPAFEPIWNRNFIDHVQITVAEEIGIGTRAGFYEETGVVRDMIQNHLLQLLCMTAIEPPLTYDADALRGETAKVLQAVASAPPDLEKDVVLGQYAAGEVDGAHVRAYQDENGVARGSTTPTYAALKLTVDNWRWAGVPFYLRTGKRMARKLTEVAIQFKPTPHVMFPDVDRGARSLLAFRLQPDEGILYTFFAKQLGPGVAIRPVTMDFRYAETFGVDQPPRAYAWLLHDVMQGDQTLSARADWVELAWKIVDPIVEMHETSARPAPYAAGGEGPDAADELLGRDGRAWRPL